MSALLLATTAPAIAQTSPGGTPEPCEAGRAAERATVAYVYDGDTLRLTDGRKVRLLGIDTPEVAHGERAAEPYAEAARARLAELTPPGTRVGLRFDTEHRDKYGRTLAHVLLAGAINVQMRLLADGLATTLVVPPNQWNASCYAGVEAGARRAGLRLWSLPRYRPTPAIDLPSSSRGYRIVTGTVARVGRSRTAIWLNLTPRVALRIAREDLRYFSPMDPETLLGRKVSARGWIYRRRGELRMMVRHRAALTVLE